MNLAELILAVILQTNVNNTNKLQLNNHNPSVFTPGESLNERNLIRDSDLAKREAEQSRQSSSRYRATSAREGDREHAKAQTNPYPYGWCTYWAAQKANISASYGNARNWPTNTKEPQVGAVVVTYESSLGHVAYVESVGADDFTISEMNYLGWGKVNTRTIKKNAKFIKGYLI